MDMVPDSAASVFRVPADVDFFPDLPRGSSPTSSDGRTIPGERRMLRGVEQRRVFPQQRDYQVVLLLARCRYLTAPQVMRAVWPREAMPPRQAVNALLGRLQRLGWVEKRAPLDTRLPVYQLSRRGHDVAAGVDHDVVTSYLPVPAVATAEHTLMLNDLVIAWENGQGWLPDGFSHPVRVVTERQITAADKAPARVPKRFQRRQQSHVFVVPGGEDQAADEPTYGYLTLDGRRGFPDALILPASAMRVEGAIAVELERTAKEGRDYARVLRAYKRTAERTGRYSKVLYLSPDQSILDKVRTAAANVGAEHLLLTKCTPRPIYREFPERTTPVQPRRGQTGLSVGRALWNLPKRSLIEWLIRNGLADAAAEALEATENFD